MIDNAEATVIEFHKRVVEAEKELEAMKLEVARAARDVRDARKAFTMLLEEMASPQMALPFAGADKTQTPAVAPEATGNGEAHVGEPEPAADEDWRDTGPDLGPDGPGFSVRDEPAEDWTAMGLDVLADHGVTAADRRCLIRAGLETFGKLVDFLGGDKGLASLPGIGPKGAERIEAGINAWVEANPA